MRGVHPVDKSDVESTTWVLCWQAAVGREFFVTPALVARIRSRLIGAHERPGRVLVDYLLLSNEIHAISRIPGGDSVGSIARAFGNVLSRWVREAQPIRSPVLAGPYRGQRLESAEELRTEVQMLAWRPVSLGLCSTPTHCRHGTLRIVLGMTPAKGFDARPLLRMFGDTVPAARDGLKRMIGRRPSEQERRAWELARGLELAAGTIGPRPSMSKAVDGAAALLIAAGGSMGIDGALALLETWVRFKVHPVREAGSGSEPRSIGARGRALVACLAVTHHLCSAASVARFFDRAKATLSEQMSACRARPSDQSIVATPLRRIVDEALALQAVQQGESRINRRSRNGGAQRG